MRETKRHADAFNCYYELGADRSYPKVASKFTVSRTSVKKWSKAFDWLERVAQRDIENNKKLEERSDAAVVNTKAKYRAEIAGKLKGLQAIRSRYEALLAKLKEPIENGEIEAASISDMDKLAKSLKSIDDTCRDLIKLDMLLMGEATDRSEQQHTLIDVLREARKRNERTGSDD